MVGETPRKLWDDFPLFRSEEQIATLVIGKDRAKEWPRIAKLLETEDDFPPIDRYVLARYWPAVVAYFHNRWNVDLYWQQKSGPYRIMPRPLKGEKE
jgi:hypothetical protein